MKYRIFIAVLFLMANLLISQQGISQGTTTLRVIDMPGFPDLPQDTVYEQNQYTFNVVIYNGTNQPVTGVDVELKVDSIVLPLLTSPATQISSGDTVTLLVQGYNFTQPQFKAGNNIVVVWPVANSTFLPVDTFITAVHFIPLSSLSTNEPESPQLSIYLVPASDVIHIETNPGNTVEYVRIFDVAGRLVFANNTVGGKSIDISHLENGLYILEAIFNGQTVRRKFIRE